MSYLEDMTEGYIYNKYDCAGCEFEPSNKTHHFCYACSRNTSLKSTNIDRYTHKPQCKPSDDVINRPQHYLFGGMELIDIIDALLLDGGFTPFQGFYVATILQYIVRFPKKNGLQDLRKARFYLNRLIEVWEGEE